MSEDSAQLNSLLKDARLPDHQEVLMVVQGFPPLAVSNLKLGVGGVQVCLQGLQHLEQSNKLLQVPLAILLTIVNVDFVSYF